MATVNMVKLRPIFKSPLEPHRFREYKAVLMAVFTRGALNVLEVGCGYRHYASYCRGELYLGVDVRLEPDVVASASALPMRSGCFDRVVMLDVLEHVRDIERALEECKRVLRGGGLLMLLTPNPLGFGLYDSFADPTHIHHFTWQGLEKMLRRHGLYTLARIPLHVHILRPFHRLVSRRLILIQQSICLVAVKRYEA